MNEVSSLNIFELIGQSIKDYYELKNPNEALKKLDEAIIIDGSASPFAYQFKADILRDTGRIEEALEVLNNSLQIFPENYELLKRRAQLLGFFKANIEDALHDINKAMLYFESGSSSQMKFVDEIKGDKVEFVKNYAANKVDLKSIEEQLNRLHGMSLLREEIQEIKNNMERRVNDAEEKISKERFRSIEMLGIFTAILGFIFASVQRIPALSNFSDMLLFGLVLVLPLCLFILLLHLIFGGK